MKHLKIIVADDILINRILIKEILTEFDCDVFEAKNGKCFNPKCITNNEDVDIVLLDIEMPVMNGLETVEYIRKEFSFPQKNLPVIALTAHDPTLYFTNYKDVGFNNLITKPYTYTQIKSVFDSIFK
ncbi:response regulator [Bacteroidota bacterium]